MKLTHINEQGHGKMVDISSKDVTSREATASGVIHMNPKALTLILDKQIEKGDVLAIAQVAGIMAAKKTSDLIPMCHPLFLTGIDILFFPDLEHSLIKITATVKTNGKTGVEMEALSAISATALTIYDMCKAIDKSMCITDIQLDEKIGGKSGHYQRRS